MLNVLQLKRHCERLSTEAEDDDERNAYREIAEHIEAHRPEKDGLILDLAYKAYHYERRAGDIRRVAPSSMVVDSLESKARICKAMVKLLGGLKI